MSYVACSVTLRHRIRFYQQLAVLTRAGLPLRSSLERLQSRISGPEVGILSRQINDGQQLGDAFIAAGFSPFECHLVLAGERSAQLDVVFNQLAEYWTRELHLAQSLTRALYYPIVMLHLTIFVGALTELGHGAGAVIATLVKGLVLLYVIGLLLYAFIRVTWRSDGAQRFWLFLPIIGNALATAYSYRWISALRMEFVAGVPIPDAVADAWLASGYVGSEAFAQEGESEMRSGIQLSALVERWRKLPRDWVDFVETGEISGALETAFTNLEAEAAHSWQMAQHRMTEWLPKIFSFVLLIIVAVMIGRMMYSQELGQIDEVNKAINGQ